MVLVIPGGLYLYISAPDSNVEQCDLGYSLTYISSPSISTAYMDILGSQPLSISHNMGPSREACDRCHYMKTRCVRAPGSQICVRCTRVGSSCNYSPPRPTGRPLKQSKSRSASHKSRGSIASLSMLSKQHIYICIMHRYMSGGGVEAEGHGVYFVTDKKCV